MKSPAKFSWYGSHEIWQVSDGLVSTPPAITFTSQKIAVVTKGTVDLKTKEIKLNFNNNPPNN